MPVRRSCCGCPRADRLTSGREHPERIAVAVANREPVGYLHLGSHAGSHANAYTDSDTYAHHRTR